MVAERQPHHGSQQTWRTFLAHELFEYLYNFVFLAVFLVAFAWYGRLMLATYHIPYLHYWMPLIEAAILAKIIMVGDALHLGRRLRNQPLAVITIYRSVTFSLFVLLFTCVEHVVAAIIHGKTVTDGFREITRKGTDEVLAQCVVIFAAFLPFFALKEIERVFGAEEVRSLFFRKRPQEHRPADHGPVL